MRRAALISLLTLAVGCASSRTAELEAENAALRRQLRSQSEPEVEEPAPLGPTDVTTPDQLSDPPYFGSIGSRPPQCDDGGLCLMITNRRPHNALVWINCDPTAQGATCGPVVLRGGVFVPPNGVVFVRLYRPGHHTIRAWLFDRVDAGWGRSIPTTLPREECAINRVVGGIGDVRRAITIGFDAFTCWSVNAR